MSRMLVHKFSSAMRMFQFVNDDDSLKDELLGDQLFLEEIQDVIGSTTSGIPHVGLASGVMTVGKHVYAHKQNIKNESIPKFKKPGVDDDGSGGPSTSHT